MTEELPARRVLWEVGRAGLGPAVRMKNYRFQYLPTSEDFAVSVYLSFLGRLFSFESRNKFTQLRVNI